MKANNIYNASLSKSYFSFYIEFKNKKESTYTEVLNGKKLVIQGHYIKSGRYSIHCWFCPENEVAFSKYGICKTEYDPIYDSGCDPEGSIKYHKGDKYQFTFNFNSNEMHVRKLLSNKEAIEILKTIPNKYYSFNRITQKYDIQCSCGNRMSSGHTNRVKIATDLDKLSEEDHVFVYKNKLYYAIPEWKQYIKTFWNYEEYNKIYKDYGWNDFDTEWNNLLRDTNKTTVNLKNIPAAGWRDTSGKVYYFESSPVIGAYEKVISKGLMATPAPGTVECPYCGILHNIYSDTDCYYPAHIQLKNRLLHLPFIAFILRTIHHD